jgi:dUTP pyrophosphatase
MPILPVQILGPGGQLPTRAHPDDAGLDFYLPEPVAISGIGNLIPLKIAVAVPPGYVLVLKDRSGNAARHGLRIAAGVIDSGYRGEVRVLVDAPWGSAVIHLEAGARICQGLLLPIPAVQVEGVESLPPSSRGAGGFGSTGA